MTVQITPAAYVKQAFSALAMSLILDGATVEELHQHVDAAVFALGRIQRVAAKYGEDVPSLEQLMAEMQAIAAEMPSAASLAKRPTED